MDNRENMVHFKKRETYRSSKASIPNLSLTLPAIHWVPGKLSSGVKRSGRVAEHSPQYTTKFKDEWSYNSTPPLALIAFTRNIHFNNIPLHKGHPMTCLRRPRAEARYSTNPLAVSALQVGRWSASLSREKTGHPLHRRLTGPRGRSRRRGKSRPQLDLIPELSSSESL